VSLSATVVVADDHPPTRAGIRAALERGGFVVCGEASTAQAAIDVVSRERPDVCMLDIHMPGNGLRAATMIREASPGTAVVMLTVSAQVDDLFQALCSGAVGYLLKDTRPDDLPDLLRAVLDGEAVLAPALVRRMVTAFRDRGQPGKLFTGGGEVRLSSREWEVLELMHEGLSTAQIAERLFVSKVTVRSHVGSILRKLHVPDRQAAVRLYRGEPH
jgi:DNA-binding NarL/FixJ family response regulator